MTFMSVIFTFIKDRLIGDISILKNHHNHHENLYFFALLTSLNAKISMYKHINSLTSLRGIAALIVVVHHFYYYALPKTGSTLSAYSDFFRNGYFGVDFFFILSGIIMTHVYIGNFLLRVNFFNYRSYLLSRFARIYPIYLFYLC